MMVAVSLSRKFRGSLWKYSNLSGRSHCSAASPPGTMCGIRPQPIGALVSQNLVIALVLLLSVLPCQTSGFAVPNSTNNTICLFPFECSILGSRPTPHTHTCSPLLLPPYAPHPLTPFAKTYRHKKPGSPPGSTHPHIHTHTVLLAADSSLPAGHTCLPSLYPYRYISSTQKVCRCPADNYAGNNCSAVCVGGAANPCNHHGECLYATGACNCDEGWIGAGCTGACPRNNGVVCSNLGTCSLNLQGKAVCNCPNNRKGAQCQIECIGGAAGPCSGHGVCQEDGQCVCDGSWPLFPVPHLPLPHLC